MTQMSLATGGETGFELHGKTTRRAAFVAKMDALIPWTELLALIEPHYPKAGNGRPPRDMETMLRMYLVSLFFNLSDVACEDELYESESLRRFCKIDLGRHRAPDATTLMNFRHLLERGGLGAALFARVGQLLLAQGLKLAGGTIVDATIIAAPSSTKNAGQTRDPEMRQSKKGNQWHFGMKLHIGVDSQSGLVHSAVVTSANVHDKHALPDLLHGAERRVYGDRGYQGQGDLIKQHAPQAKDFTNRRVRRPDGTVDETERARNRNKSRIRARVEHPFLTLKCLWRWAKVRYRGLAKNANKAFAMLALSNIVKWNRPLTPKVRLG